MRVTSTVRINRPRQEVWDYFDNPDNLKAWLRGFEEFVPLEGELGQPGSKAKHIYREKNRTFEMEETIVAREEPKLFAGLLTHPAMESDLSVTLEEAGASETVLTCEMKTRFKSFAFKLFGPLMKKSFQKRQDANFAQLKACVEAIPSAVDLTG